MHEKTLGWLPFRNSPAEAAGPRAVGVGGSEAMSDLESCLWPEGTESVCGRSDGRGDVVAAIAAALGVGRQCWVIG